MLRSMLLATLVLIVTPLLALAQEEEKPPPTPDEQAAAYLAEVKSGMSKMSIPDKTEATKKMVTLFNTVGLSEGTLKPVVGLLAKLAKDKEPTVRIAAIEALGSSRSAGSSKAVLAILKKVLKSKEPSVEEYGACFSALKLHADLGKKTTAALVKYLRHKNDDVIAKTLNTLAGYGKAPGKIRKELLEETIKNTEGLYNGAQSASNTTAVRKWNIVQTSARAALRALSGQKFANPSEARSWYNNNKKNKKLWK